MQLVFTPDLGSSTTIAALPGSALQLAARVSSQDYEYAVSTGTFVEIWSDLPRPGAPAGEWGATRFIPAPKLREYPDPGAPPNVLSLLPADPEPVPTSSAAPETTLLIASFVIPPDTDSIDYQFTYRLAHTNESGIWHTWLGDSGSNGHLIIKPDAPPVEGFVFTSPWDTTDNVVRHSAPDGTVASLAGEVEWSGWALDLDSTKEDAATPQRFAGVPTELSATHLVLFPAPGLTTLNPTSHRPVLLSTSSRLSLSGRDITAHGGPIRYDHLSRSALESSLPEHAVLLPKSAASAPYVILHDTRGSSLSILPTSPTPLGTQVISLNLEKVSATPPAKTLVYSSLLNSAAICTPGSRVAITPLGADIQVCEVYALEGQEGEWEAGLVGGLQVQPEPEPVQEEEEVESDQETEAELDATPTTATPAPAPVAEPTKVIPPPIQTTTNTVVHAESLSPITPETARTPHPAASSASVTSTPHDHNKTVLELIKGVYAAVVFYFTRGAWSMFGWGFKMFGVGVHAANANTNTNAPKEPEPAPEPVVEESESESELNEVAPTPIDPMHVSAPVVVGTGTGPSVPGPKDGVNMPLTPPMSPKTTAPLAIPGPEEPAPAPKQKTKKLKVKFQKPAPKPKLAFTAPKTTTLVVLSEAHANPAEKLKLSVGGEVVPADKLAGVKLTGSTGKAWVVQVGGESKVEVGLV
ncbi:hypothetical protein FRC08_002287 [Ceratobasidium sp. 394]|nr:hypothetical protein FRC08_002287 [Ceratobasidium sp. 394]